jgi:hypothetical protein
MGVEKHPFISCVADPGCLSRIRIFFLPGSRIRIKDFKYRILTKKIVSKLTEYDPGCSSQILIYYPSRIQGSKRHRIGSRIRIRNTVYKYLTSLLSVYATLYFSHIRFAGVSFNVRLAKPKCLLRLWCGMEFRCFLCMIFGGKETRQILYRPSQTTLWKNGHFVNMYCSVSDPH